MVVLCDKTGVNGKQVLPKKTVNVQHILYDKVYKQILPASLCDNSGRLHTLVTEYCPGSPCSNASLFVGITNSTSVIVGYDYCGKAK
jgi:hypothetical protein